MNTRKARFLSQSRRMGLIRHALSAGLVLGLAAGLPSYSAGAVEQPAATDPSPATATAGEGSTPVAGPPAVAATESAQAETQYLPLTQLAEQYGIQITLVAVTGAGGLVDFRFKVLDPDKARKLVGEPPTMPALVAKGSDLRIETSHKMMHAIRLQKNAVSYALYPNVRGAVKPGTPVSAAFGELRVEPVNAQ
jgi:hypothetical protein